jgi:hypothetical protein
MSHDPRQRSDRQDKAMLGAHVHESTRRAVKEMAAREGTTVALLVQEGIGRVLAERHRALPADLKRELQSHNHPVPTPPSKAG